MALFSSDLASEAEPLETLLALLALLEPLGAAPAAPRLPNSCANTPLCCKQPKKRWSTSRLSLILHNGTRALTVFVALLALFVLAALLALLQVASSLAFVALVCCISAPGAPDSLCVAGDTVDIRHKSAS
jgi:hypothetical protein